MTAHTTSHLRNKFRPQLESLESRQLLTCGVFESGGTLSIVGDDNGNVIRIKDDGTSAAGNIKLNCDGIAYTSVGAINTVGVSTGDGGDVVVYKMITGLGAGVGRNVNVDLGDNGDWFFSRFLGTIDGTANFTINGNDGKDTIYNNAQATNVSTGATLALYLLGGDDDDNIYTGYRGNMSGNLTIYTEGGWDTDRISALINLSGGSAAGTLNANLKGNECEDKIGLWLRGGGAGTLASRYTGVDGGGWHDTGSHTAGVISNCETDYIVP